MTSFTCPAPPSAVSPSPAEAQASEPQGILLYYKYVPLEGGNAEEVAHFYTELCGQLGLRGRIRVARDGVNVTVGGSMAALRAHSDAVVAHPLLRGGDIDFKLAPSGGPRNEATRAETKMDRLVVRMCEELVTLGPLARHRADPRVSTAPHLTPEQFHQVLQRATVATTAPPEMAAGPATAPTAAPAENPVPERSLTAQPPPLAEAAATASATASAVAAVESKDGLAAGAGAGAGAGGSPGPEGLESPQVVLLDARNIYETRIGHFDAGPSVSLLDPRTRCFSDLPSWMDAHEELLRNRTVLMYCTGGVRCERASAYLREKGPEYSRVFQLSGGIQRYLERFPDGGFFRGKNFLYDDRIAVGPEDVQPASSGAVVGRCLVCGCAWDDYGARLRCSRCRLLLLVCVACTAAAHGHHQHQEPQQQRQQRQQPERLQAAPAAESAEVGEAGGAPPTDPADVTGPSVPVPSTPLLCELCIAVAAQDGPRCGGGAAAVQPDDSAAAPLGAAESDGVAVVACDGGSAPRTIERRAVAASPSAAPALAGTAAAVAAAPLVASTAASDAVAASGPAAGGGAPRRLRILCLHGFRQTAKQFQGRTCALRKKLRDLADFVFVDGPHSLPLFTKQQAAADSDGEGTGGAGCATSDGGGAGDDAAQVGGGLPSHYVDISAGCDEEDGKDSGAAGVDDQAEAGPEAGVATAVAAAAAPPPPPQPLAAKRAWLLPPELYNGGGTAPPADGVWREAPSYVDEMQYTRQTEGWRESLAALQVAVRHLGPFDGVFGFSQGASVAAVLCALQQRQRQHRRQHSQAQASQPDANGDSPADPAAHPPPADVSTPSCALPSAASPAGQVPPPEHPDAPGPLPGPSTDCDFGFRFAILASGFPSPLPEHRELLAEVGPLELPSLHVYGSGAGGGGGDGGGGGPDRQISARESEALAAAFSGAGGARRSLCHQSGHLIPATRGHAATFRSFLAQIPATAPPDEA